MAMEWIAAVHLTPWQIEKIQQIATMEFSEYKGVVIGAIGIDENNSDKVMKVIDDENINVIRDE